MALAFIRVHPIRVGTFFPSELLEKMKIVTGEVEGKMGNKITLFTA